MKLKVVKIRLLLALVLAWGGIAFDQTVPTIITQPVSQSSAVGGTIQFTVSASGAGTPFELIQI